MKNWLVSILAGMLVAACGGNPRTADPVRYDLGRAAGGGAGLPLALGALDMQAASWLADTAMHYRLAYAEPLRRQSYAESRWAAAPADLLDAFLKRRLLFSQSPAGTGCRLQLVLDEFEQRFDDAQTSRQVIALRASLLTPRGGQEALARRALLVQKPAASADARGGAAAARDAAQALADELGAWLAELAREKPAIIERCRS